MQVVRTISEARAARAEMGRSALVPTMGALHGGHLSLLRLARRQTENVIVSIFVNPTQFGPREDFKRYPRPVEDDLSRCEQAGAQLIFIPEPQEMYPHLFGATQAPAGTPHPLDTIVDFPFLTSVLEGKHRPGHFKGVCQIVAKLFNILRPDLAVFGQKDFQQLRVIRAMVESLNLPIDVIAGPTLRDTDGLAMSSRNQFLSTEERARALSISRALSLAAGEHRSGVRQTNRLITSVQNMLLEQHLNIDYVAAVDADTLRPVQTVDGPTVLAIAARVGNTRLIDNVVLNGD